MKKLLITMLSSLLFCCSTFGRTNTPDWVVNFKKVEDKNYRYYIGLSSKNDTIEDGYKNAYTNATQEVIQSEFGVNIKYNFKIESTLKKIEFNDDISAKSKTINLDGLSTEDKFIENINQKFNVWILLKFDKQKLAKEKERLKKTTYEEKLNFNDNNSLIGNNTITSGKLKVITIPDRAQIYLDDEIIGISNSKFQKIGVGKYVLTIKKSGYISKSIQIYILPNEETLKTITLEKDKGSIKIDAYPSGVKVYLNDKTYKNYEKHNLEVGEYNVRVEKTGYFKYETTIEILPGKELDFYASLKPKPGSITITTSPADANVYIDNIFIGKTPIVGYKAESQFHSIEITKYDYITETHYVEIQSEKTKAYNYNLTKATPIRLISSISNESSIQENNHYQIEYDNHFYFYTGLGFETQKINSTALPSFFLDIGIDLQIKETIDISIGGILGTDGNSSTYYPDKIDNSYSGFKLKLAYQMKDMYIGIQNRWLNYDFVLEKDNLETDYTKAKVKYTNFDLQSTGIVIGTRVGKSNLNFDFELGIFFTNISNERVKTSNDANVYLGIILNIGK